METKNYFLICDCGLAEHQLIFRYFPNAVNIEKDLYIDVHLGHWENFFRRIWIAVKYVFNYKSKYGEFDEVVVSRSEAENLINYLKEYVDSFEK